MKRHVAARMIIERLEKGPATPKQLSDELKIPYKTVLHNVSKFLPALGIINQLPNNRYMMRWAPPEEYEIKSIYHLLQKKLARSPTPEETSGHIKRSPNESRDLLFKYIPSYLEPGQDEISSSTHALFKTIVAGKLDLPTKKCLFEMGIEKVTFIGLDQHTLFEILKDDQLRAKAEGYLKDFPDMAPGIQIEKTGRQLIYRINHSEEARKMLKRSIFEDHISEIRVPSKLDREGYQRYKSMLAGNRAYALGKIEEIARSSASTPDVIEDLLEWLEMPGKRDDILIALKNFCQNNLEIGDVDEATRAKIRFALRDVAFGMDREYEESSREGYMARDYAFSVIELLGADDESVADAKEFVLAVLEKGYITGNYLMRVGRWLASSAEIRKELMDRAENLFLEMDDEKIVNGCSSFMKLL